MIKLKNKMSANAKMDVDWSNISNLFFKSNEVINLNSAGISAPPQKTVEAMNQLHVKLSEAPSFHTWQTFEEQKKRVRTSLAAISGAAVEEIAITRNATEALADVIFGIELRSGDEVVLSKYDYPNAINAWKQRELRDGIKLVWVDLELPSEIETELVDAYISKFSSRTRLVHLTHVINWNGQIIPAGKIAQIANSKGIEVLIDGSQSFALLDYKISDLNCDYFATSLHKWLNGPTGTGMLYVKKEKISSVYPLMGNKKPQSADIRKFESYGIRNIAAELGIQYSIDFHNSIGAANKRQRLFDLKNRWMKALESIPDIQFFTSFSSEWSCAIGTVNLLGFSSTELVRILFEKWKIHVTTADREKIKGIRVTPGIATTEAEIDRFVDAMFEINKSNIWKRK